MLALLPIFVIAHGLILLLVGAAIRFEVWKDPEGMLPFLKLVPGDGPQKHRLGYAFLYMGAGMLSGGMLTKLGCVPGVPARWGM